MASNIFQSALKAAQAIPGLGSSYNKLPTQVHHSEQGVPLCNPPQYPPQYGYGYGHGPPQQCDPHSMMRPSPKHEVLLGQFRKMRRWTKIAIALSSTISALLSVFMESIMIYVTYKHYKTKDLYVEGRAWGPWAKDTKLWPTYLLAGASLATLLMCFGLLVALCCRSKRKTALFSLLGAAVHIVFWVVISILYRVGKTNKDLWGWSCTDEAKAIQDQLGSNVLNFQSLCTLQSSSWDTSIGEVVLKIATTVVSWFFHRMQNFFKDNLIGDLGSGVFDHFDD